MDYVTIEKMKWRSRRSILELDLYFDRFITSGGFGSLAVDELVLYQQLLSLEDGDLLLLFQGKEELSDSNLQGLVNKIVKISFYKEFI